MSPEPAQTRRNAPGKRPQVNLRAANAGPSKALSSSRREQFCQLVAAGTQARDAYTRAGYSGNDTSRQQLRRQADVDARINWIIRQRIESDAALRHRAEKPIADARLRLVRELEKIAYSDIRQLVQWDKQPVLDPDGNVVGERDRMTVTPSHRLKPGAAATVKSVTTKSGALKFDVHDKLNALNTLAKILGVTTDAPPPVQSVTVNQVNVGPSNALEAARRLAFALAAAQQAALAAPQPAVTEDEKAE
jgi:Terminase small subunit